MINEYGAQCYTKKNGKWVFEPVELPFYGDVSLANGTQFRVGVFAVPRSASRIFVGVEGRGAYTFGSFVHPSYVSEKFNLPDSDANAMANFINAQLGFFEKQFGEIQERFL